MPAVVAISGSAAPRESFRLAQLGVRAFLSKPIDLTSLDETLETVLAEPPDLAGSTPESTPPETPAAVERVYQTTSPRGLDHEAPPMRLWQ